MLIYNNCIKYGAEKLYFENTAKPHSNTKIYRRENFSLILGGNTYEKFVICSARKQFSTENMLKPFSDRVKLIEVTALIFPI